MANVSLRLASLVTLCFLTLTLLIVGLAPQGQGTLEQWHIQTPHFVVGEANAFQKDPVISPNGTRIAYASMEDGGANFDIWTMSIDGTDKIQITDNPWDEVKPRFTPDGRYLSLVDRWGGSYLVESYGQLSLYPHTENKIWENLTYDDGNYTYTYPLVPTIMEGLWGSELWQVDKGNWSVIAQLQSQDDQGQLRFVELPPVVSQYYDGAKRWVNQTRQASPPYWEYSWWQISNQRFSYAQYNQSANNWGDCAQHPCWPEQHEAYTTPQWLDVVSFSSRQSEPGEEREFFLSAYDNSSYINLYRLTIPWREDGVGAYDWARAKLTRLTDEEANQRDPVVNPVDNLLYYTSKEDGDKYYDIWKMDDQGNRQQVTFEDFNQLTPTFDPGYDMLYFASDEHGDYYYDIYRTASQPGFPLTDFKAPRTMYRVHGREGPEGMVTFLSPDGSGTQHVFVGRLDGTGVTQLTDSQMMFQWGFDQFRLGSPRMNRDNTTVAVDVYYYSQERGNEHWRFAQLLIQRVGETWESRDMEVFSSYRAGSWDWPNEGVWYNASNIAFDPTDHFMALPGAFHDSGGGPARWNAPAIYFRPSTRSWIDASFRLDFQEVYNNSGDSAENYVHHSPAWMDADTLLMLRADVNEVTQNGFQTRYEIVRFVNEQGDGWNNADKVTIKPTGIVGQGYNHLTATAQGGLKLAWTEPVIDNDNVQYWQMVLALYNTTSEDWELSPVEPADGLGQRTTPALLDGNHLIYSSNDPRWLPNNKELFIFNIRDQTSAPISGVETATSINGLQVNPNGNEVVFLGQRLDEDEQGGDGGGGNGPADMATGPILWFYDLQERSIGQLNINDATCNDCQLQSGDRFSIITVHYRTSDLLILTVLIEHWEDRGEGEELVGFSSLDVYLLDISDRQDLQLYPLITSEYIELVSDVKGDEFLYATDYQNVLGEGDVWLARFEGPDDLNLTRLTDKPYVQWSGVFGPTDDTIYYLSDESGDDYSHIWQLKRLGPEWSLNNQATQVTSGRHNYESPSLMPGTQLLLYTLRDKVSYQELRDVRILDLETGDSVPVASSPANEDLGVYDPNSKLILYVRQGDGYNEFHQIFAIDFDGDGDGHTENVDAFPSDPTEWSDNDGDGRGDNVDTDDDNDRAGPDGILGNYDDGGGLLDQFDAFPLDPAEWLDSDGDGIGDNADAFDTDPAAAIDGDGDGYPDGWNPGKSQDDSTTGLTLDAFPANDNEWTDTDGDGQGDNADTDDDGDGVQDGNDDFPLDDREYQDTDGDSTGDEEDEDDDNDGYNDDEDAFPLNANEHLDTDGDGIGDNSDSDDDGDGWADTSDDFPLDRAAWLDTDGDGDPDDLKGASTTGLTADTDDDGDGVLDPEDAFSLNANEYLDTDGDGTGDNSDTDDDGDGWLDSTDDFPLDPAAWLDTDNDGKPDELDGNSTTNLTADDDDDGDSILDVDDAFPTNPNENKDTDGDGVGDNTDTDDDSDGVLDSSDKFPLDHAAWQDTDGDGKPDELFGPSSTGLTEDNDDDQDSVLDGADAFPTNPNEYEDSDGDGVGDNADSDDDNDGTSDKVDLFPNDPTEWADMDGDGTGDNSDSDRDGDGKNNGEEDFPDDPTEWYDSDGDGMGDNADPDADNDGILNENDEEPTDPEGGYWDLPVMGQLASKSVKDTFKALSPILISAIAGPFVFMFVKHTRYGYYRRAIRKIDSPQALRDFYRFDMEVAMYNWKVWWKHQMKLRELYVSRMKELGGDPTIPMRDSSIMGGGAVADPYRPSKLEPVPRESKGQEKGELEELE